MVARCIANEVSINQRYTKLANLEYSVNFTKEELGLLILAIEAVVGLGFMFYFLRLEGSMEQYAEVFDQKSLEMIDFTLRVQNLPTDLKYGNNREVLQAYLISHFENVIQK